MQENQTDAILEFHEDLLNQVNISATSGADFLQTTFFDIFCEYLDEAGEIETPEYCFYENPQKTCCVTGYHLDQTESGNGALDLYITIYSGEKNIVNINKKEYEDGFKHLFNFFKNSITEDFYKSLDVAADAYNLAYLIYTHKNDIKTVNLYLLTDKQLSTHAKSISATEYEGYIINYNLWDLSKLYKLNTSGQAPEDIVVDFVKDFGVGLSSLAVDLKNTDYKAYLSVVPGQILADLYKKYGAHLLESNVRTFLQVKGKVNKGIRDTIVKYPEYFFAYNNGITATAENVVFKDGEIKSVTNLQIVNGGQTTASIYNAFIKEKADLQNVFVQMKLSEVSHERADEMVPNISKYANSQNKVNDADFFSVRPFHKEMEKFSRTVLAPAANGAFIQTKWFYERSRGQYLNEKNAKTGKDKKDFELVYPYKESTKDLHKHKQYFTKTDLAKYEGVWLQMPHIVSKGAQYIFNEYANWVENKWQKDEAEFNIVYYKTAIAKAIIFKTAEKIIINEPWYSGYRANIVAYSLAYLAYRLENDGKSVDFMKVWDNQRISDVFVEVLRKLTKSVRDYIYASAEKANVLNISEFCKMQKCWDWMKGMTFDFPSDFEADLTTVAEAKQVMQEGKKDQKFTNQLAAEIQVVEIGEKNWRRLLEFAVEHQLDMGHTERGILSWYFMKKHVSSKQANVLIKLLQRMQEEGFELQ